MEFVVVWLSCEDLDQISADCNIEVYNSKLKKSRPSVTTHAREPKEDQVKSIALGECTDIALCPVRTLGGSITRTTNFRHTLPIDPTLLSTFLE